MAVFSGPEIVNNGLVFHLDAANSRSYPGSGTTWADLTINGNNGTLLNGVGFGSENKGTMIFDGVNDNAVYSSLNSLSNTNITVSAWIRPVLPSGLNDLETIVCRFHASNQPTFRLMYGTFSVNGDTIPRFEIYNNSFKNVASTAQLTINMWVNLVGTYSSTNSGEMSLYVNGNNVETKSNVGSLATYNNTRLYIGSTDTVLDTSRFYCGANISNVQIYNRALTAAEIRQNFEATRSRYGI
jgi:hypothetical protein